MAKHWLLLPVIAKNLIWTGLTFSRPYEAQRFILCLAPLGRKSQKVTSSRDDKSGGGASLKIRSLVGNWGLPPIFITFGWPQAHDLSGRDDNFVMRFTYILEERLHFSANELSSRPERSVVEGPALVFPSVLTQTLQAVPFIR